MSACPASPPRAACTSENAARSGVSSFSRKPETASCVCAWITSRVSSGVWFAITMALRYALPALRALPSTAFSDASDDSRNAATSMTA